MNEERSPHGARSPRRLACYGWVDSRAGSVAGANYLVVQELVRRGVTVDFYANRAHVPHPLIGNNALFSYIGLPPPRSLSLLPRKAERIANWAFSPLVRAEWRRAFMRIAARRHDQAPYAASLALGVPPAFSLYGVPTVSWLQGPPHTELEAIRQLSRSISEVNGRWLYWQLVSYYRLSHLLDRNVLRECDDIIIGSPWSREAMASHGPNSAGIHVIPYPIDLKRFTPSPSVRDLDCPLILCLGRLDPRKRLDLLLESFEVLLEQVPSARLLIVGRPGYAPKQLSLVDRFKREAHVVYRPAIERKDVIPLLRSAACLVQPSMNENFGSAVAEALACGTPVVVGASNGTSAYISPRSRVFDRYEPHLVAQRLLEVLDEQRGDPRGVAIEARATAERYFSLAPIVDRLCKILFDRDPCYPRSS